MLKVEFLENKCEVVISKRGCNINIQLYCYDEGVKELFITASAFIEGLNDGEVAIRNYSVGNRGLFPSSGILDTLINADIVKEPHRFIPSGFVTLPIVRLTDKAINYIKE